MINYKSKLVFLIILLFIFILPSPIEAAPKTFRANFNDNNLNGWIVVPDPEGFLCPEPWEIKNGMVGISIAGGNCSTNLMPNDTLWNNLGDNYIFELDMKIISGSDHNIAFRFTPSTTNNKWYDLHFQSPGDFTLERVTGSYSVNTVSSYPERSIPYHIKIIVDHLNIKIYIDNVLVRDFTSSIDNHPTGRIALRASTGGGSNETYFDNISVTSLDTTTNDLEVPYFSQNALPWGPTELDSMKSLGISRPTIESWGCAVTSAAMVLNYYGMTVLPGNILLNPGSLNLWLKANNGFLTGTGSGGAYSYMNWNVIGTLSKQLFDQGLSTVKLMHQRLLPNAGTTQIVNDDLSTKFIPDIFWVKNAVTTSHFVVAKGINNGIYDINDPKWNYPTLTAFNDSYMQVDRYIPSHTNLSYLTFVVNPDVEILVTDPNGKKTGKYIHNGQTQEFNEIPNATYAFEKPISNSDILSNLEEAGTGVNEFLLPEPSDGDYIITLSSKSNTLYTFNIASFEQDGAMDLKKVLKGINTNQDITTALHFGQTTHTTVDNLVTFASAINDINTINQLGLLHDNTLDNHFTMYIQQAQAAYNTTNKNRASLAKNYLVRFQQSLDQYRGKKVDELAYQVLTSDVQFLIKSL